MARLIDDMSVSERRVCRAVGQPRSTQRYVKQRPSDEPELVKRLHELARDHPRHGYRMMTGQLQLEGWHINHKRVYRLCRQEGLKVPQKKRKRRSLGCTNNGVIRQRSNHKNDVWAWDFIFDRDECGRALKWFVMIDEYTRECLTLEVGRRMRSEDVLNHLRDLMLIRGVPNHIRSDNGPEFIAADIRKFLSSAGVGTLYIEPGAPWENGIVESFNSRLRDELLECEIFENLNCAKKFSEHWFLYYNHRRPHGALKYQTPAQYAASCEEAMSSPPPLGAAPLVTAGSTINNGL